MLAALRACRACARSAATSCSTAATSSPPRTDIGAAPFDETPEFRYNVIPDALLVDSNLVRLELVVGRRAGASWRGSPRRSSASRSCTSTDARRSRLRGLGRRLDASRRWTQGRRRRAARQPAGRLPAQLRGRRPSINVIDRVTFVRPAVPRALDAPRRAVRGQVRATARRRRGRACVAEHLSRPLARVAARHQQALGQSDHARGLPHARARCGGRRARRPRSAPSAMVRALDGARTGSTRPGSCSRTARGSRARSASRPRSWPRCCASRPARARGRRSSSRACRSSASTAACRKRLRGSAAAGRARIKTGTLRDAWRDRGLRDRRGGRELHRGGDDQPRARGQARRASGARRADRMGGGLQGTGGNPALTRQPAACQSSPTAWLRKKSRQYGVQTRMGASMESPSLAGTRLDKFHHVCAFFDSREEEYAILGPFFKEGLDWGEKSVHIVDPAPGRQATSSACTPRASTPTRAVRAASSRSSPGTTPTWRAAIFDQDRMMSAIDSADRGGARAGLPAHAHHGQHGLDVAWQPRHGRGRGVRGPRERGALAHPATWPYASTTPRRYRAR